ncbi:MAG: hypothetical protein RSC33_07630, partial [Vagococcus sp.]
KNMVVAELKGTSCDAYKTIIKKLDPIFHGEILKNVCAMPDSFRVKVTPVHGDIYSEEEGIKTAKAKVLRNYYKSKDKAVQRGLVYTSSAAITALMAKS